MSLARSLGPAGGVSVVICAYTERRWVDLRRAVDSVLAQSRRPLEVIVVIDHNAVLLERARRHWGTARTGVNVVPNIGGPGLSSARNTGVAEAAGEIVAFLDDDATAPPDWIALLVAGFDAGVVAVGGPARAVPDRQFPNWWPPEFNWVIGCSWTGLPVETAPVRNVVGCNMAFRRDAVVNAGGFRVGIGRIGDRPAGCEETDLCIRVTGAAKGSRVMYIAEAAVDHRVSADRLQWRYFVRRCFAEGRSKAEVTRRNGRATGLTSEREYVRRVLPRAVARALADAAPGRAVAIITGLVATSAGYLAGPVLS